MPEFKPSKHTRVSKDQQMRDYRSERKKKKSVFGAKNRRKKQIEHEARIDFPPQSPVRKQMVEEQRKREEINKRVNNHSDLHRSKRKTQGRRRRKKSMLLYRIMISVAFIVVISVLSVTVLFNIGNISVNGSEKYTSDEIISVSGISEGDNLLRINIGLAEQNILGNLVYIDTVSISRGFPNRLNITVTDAQPMADFKNGSGYFVVSFKGKILEDRSQPSNNYVIEGFEYEEDLKVGSIVSDNEKKQLAVIKELIEEMESFGLSSTAVIDISDTMNIKIDYDGRIKMELGSASQLHEKMYAASVLLTEKIGSDERVTMLLENPERVVTRPIYDSEIDDDGFIAETTPEETSSEDPVETSAVASVGDYA